MRAYCFLILMGVGMVGSAACIGDPAELGPWEDQSLNGSEEDVGLGGEDVHDEGDLEPEPGDGDVEPDPEPGDGDGQLDPDPDPDLFDCSEFATIRGGILGSTEFEPTTAQIYEGDPFGMVVEGAGSLSGYTNLGLEVVDRTNGVCVTHSEEACVQIARIVLAHGEAPAAGDYCIFFTTRGDHDEKVYRSVAEVTIISPPAEHGGLSCRDAIGDPNCFGTSPDNEDTSLQCKIENEGSCAAGF